jgi:ABC-type branched-subunit amino acid transport system ATPase component/branched-subunit amino acid ABC-type transport system permease component
MITQIIEFAILGIGAGAAYALAGLGIVLVYRGSGVLNFANSAIGMIGCYVFYELWQHGTPLILAALVAVVLSGAIGAGANFGLIWRIRESTPITQLVATLGLFSLLVGIGELAWGYYTPTTVRELITARSLYLTHSLSIGTDRLTLLGIAVVLTGACSLIYKRTRFGLATSAVARSRRGTAALGYSTALIATINWAFGAILAAVAAILTANLGTLEVEPTALIVIPAVAAALIGSFRSYWLTLLGGLLIGILDSESAFLQVHFPQLSGVLSGWAESVPFIVIIVVLVIRGRPLPVRGEQVTRPPRVGTGVAPLWASAIMAGIFLVLALTLPPDDLFGLITSAGIALVLLSIVVITGLAGQLSLAQFAIAGVAAWAGSKLVASMGWNYELSWLVVVAVTIPGGMLIGIPALRTRGINLAVVTLGLASIIQAQTFGNQDRSGGLLGLNIGSPTLFGFNVDSTIHPQRYAILSVIVVGIGIALVANLRRSGTGRRLLAVRSNERAAASLGISLTRSKLYAFALASALAACGGLLLAFSGPTPEFLPMFDQTQSVLILVIAIIGGLGFASGSVVGGIIAPGALLAIVLGPVTSHTWIGPIFNNPQVGEVVLGIVVIDVVIRHPDGAMAMNLRDMRVVRRVRKLLAARLPGGSPATPGVAAAAAGHGTAPAAPAGPGRGLRTRLAFAGAVADRISANGGLRSSQGQADVQDDPGRATALAPRLAARGDGPALVASDLVVRFGGVVALNGASLTVERGQVRGLIGANGAGKSTLVDAITGFAPLERGTVVLNGIRIDTWPAYQRMNAGLTRSFQGLELFETMTVRENLAVAGEHRSRLAPITDLVRPGRPRLSPMARSAVAMLGLESLLERRPEELSFGERRLVAIARAVAAAPAVLLLDEPGSGLEDSETRELGRLIRQLATEWNIGILLIEHNVQFVTEVCDRITALSFGEVIAEGSPAEIRRHPAVMAAYLGEESAEELTESAAAPAERAVLAEPAGGARPVNGMRPTAEPLLRVAGLAGGYHGRPVVRDLSLEVRPGEIVALLGPNGAGKTTTLLTICGELAPVAGTVSCLGHDDRTPLFRLVRDGLGFVMPERATTPDLTAQENLRLGRGSVSAALELFPELRPLLGRRAGLLSGGEQQFLSLARVLAAQPRLLLADELSLGLAPLIVARILAQLRAAADGGIGVLIVEQQIGPVLEIADRVLILKNGRTVLEEHPDNIRGDWARLASAYLDGPY